MMGGGVDVMVNADRGVAKFIKWFMRLRVMFKELIMFLLASIVIIVVDCSVIYIYVYETMNDKI